MTPDQRRANNVAHTNLVREILNELVSRADCIVWQNVNGLFRYVESEQRVKVGLPGTPDIIGLYRGGLMLLIEAKTGDAVLSSGQRIFRRNAEALGAVVCVARSKEDAVNYIDSINPKKAA